MQNDLAKQLLDSDGKLKRFDSWINDIRSISDHYVRNWLQTEYSTAIIRARQAADWQHFEQESDVLPNLRWMPTTSPNPESEHRQYWERKLTLPVGDPFWDRHRPGDRWNCKCSLMATDEPATPGGASGLRNTPGQPGLDSNPGKDGQIFSRTHPYYTQAYPGAEKAVRKISKDADNYVIVNGYRQINVTDGYNSNLTKKVINVENSLRQNKKFETAVVFNNNGDIVIDKRGKATSVTFTANDVKLMKDSIITHNHPRGWNYEEKDWGRIGNSFSKADLSLAIISDAAEIRAVTPNFTFSMKRPSSGWGVRTKEFERVYNKINDSILIENMKAINLGIVSPEQANAVHFHVLNRTLAQKFGWIYEKRRTI